VVVKFYRPARWTTPQILEEHEFALELARAEIPVVAPEVHDGRTLFELGGFRYAVYRRQGGHWPELGTADERKWMGRFLGRIHAIGRVRPFRHRVRLDWEVMGVETAQYLLEQGWIPPHIEAAYTSVAEDALALIEQRFTEATPYRTLRLHGDCHPGNVLWTDAGPHLWIWMTPVWGPPCRICGCSPVVTDETARCNGRPCWTATPRCAHLTHANSRWWNHCARCACFTTAPGWRSVATILRSPSNLAGLARRLIGRSRCASCMTRSRRCRKTR